MAIRFANFREIFSRPDYDPDGHISPETLDDLIGRYSCPQTEGEQPCQVFKKKKNGRCNEGHTTGLVGRNKAGKEVLIGNVCAAKEFNADEKFLRQRSRVDAELEFLDLTRRYNEHRADTTLQPTLNEARRRLRMCQKAQENVFRLLTERVQRTLDTMSRTGNAGVLILRHRIEVEEDEEGKKKERVNKIPHVLGSLQGVRLFSLSDAAEVNRGMEAVATAVRELVEYPEPRRVKLKSTLKALDQFKNYQTLLVRLEDVVKDFLQEANLRLLCFATRDIGARDAVAQLYIILRDDGADSLMASNYYRGSLQGECRKLIDGLDTEVVRTIAPEGFEIP